MSECREATPQPPASCSKHSHFKGELQQNRGRLLSQEDFSRLSSGQVVQLQTCAMELESSLPLATPGCSFKH